MVSIIMGIAAIFFGFLSIVSELKKKGASIFIFAAISVFLFTFTICRGDTNALIMIVIYIVFALLADIIARIVRK